MPLPLSYPGFKCILENLEAVKRAHIIARAPGLQRIDKLIPLCMNNFYIRRHQLTINKLSIGYFKDEVRFKINGKRFSREGSEILEDKMKRLVHFYICGRSKIHVDKFQFSYNYQFQSWLPDFMPADLKIRVNSLDSFSEFETAILFIDPRSFPLKTLDTTIANASTFDDQVVKSAETLNLNFIFDRIVTVEDLKKLKNQTVVFHYCSSSRIDMDSLIKYYFETKQDIRTTFVISTSNINVVREMLSNLELAFGDFQCDLDDVNERFLAGFSRFSIPINDNSRIHIYAKNSSQDGFYKIVVKPVSGL